MRGEDPEAESRAGPIARLLCAWGKTEEVRRQTRVIGEKDGWWTSAVYVELCIGADVKGS